MINKFLNLYDLANESHPSKMKLLRYLISGGMATLTNLLFLYILTDIAGIWYITSAVISYIISFIVSFSLQKYWTFQNGSNDKIRSQALIYIVVTTANLGLNTLGIFLFVELGLHYLGAQICSSIIIAVESYFVYRYLFKSRNVDANESIAMQQ